MTATHTDVPEPTAVDGDRALRVASRVSLLVALVHAAALMTLALRVIPHLRASYEDLGMRLPTVHAFFLSSDFSGWCAAIALGALAKEWLIRRPRVTLVLNGALLVLTEVVRQAWVLAADVPMIDLLMGMK